MRYNMLAPQFFLIIALPGIVLGASSGLVAFFAVTAGANPSSTTVGLLISCCVCVMAASSITGLVFNNLVDILKIFFPRKEISPT